MNYFRTYHAATSFADKNNVPDVVIYSDYVLGEDDMVYVVPLP